MDNLNEFMQPTNAPSGKTIPVAMPVGIQNQLPIGKVNYSNLDINTKPYRAVVSLARTAGAFQDIQEAINHVNKNFAGGGILIRKGRYVLSKNITLYNNIFLLGEDSLNSIIDFGQGTNQVEIGTVSNVSVENLTIQDAWGTTGAIYVANSSNIRIRNNSFSGNTGTSGSGADVFLDQVVSESEAIDVSYNKTQGCGNFLRITLGARSNSYSFNIVDLPLAEAFEAVDFGVGVPGNFLGNTVFSPIKAAFSGLFNSARLVDNTVAFSGTYATNNYAFDLTSTSRSNIIIGNRVSAATGGGIRITSGSYNDIGNNVFDSLDLPPVQLQNSFFTQINGNYLSNTSGTNPVIYMGTSSNTVITGNTLINKQAGADGALLLASSSNVITGNYIKDGGSGTAYCVRIGTNSNNNAIVGNRLEFTTGSVLDGGSANVSASNA